MDYQIACLCEVCEKNINNYKNKEKIKYRKKINLK